MNAVYLLSDFGMSDTYVAQMKSVLLRGTPAGTPFIDLTHEVPRGSVLQGAFHLWASIPSMPQGSVVLAVVDPGVGTARRAVVCRCGGIFTVGPDNGLFGLLEKDRAWELPGPPPGSSMTFHGRDLFAPAAARVATDPGWVSFLDPVEPDSMAGACIEEPARAGDGIEVSVVHVDRFGNAVLWTDPAFFQGFRPDELVAPDGRTLGLKRVPTYSDNRGLLLLRGSQGRMEIAISGGNAAVAMGISAGDRLMIRGKME